MESEKIGKFIAKLRKEKKMTQNDLAQYLYTDRTTISKWERGLYIPKQDFILKLSELFDISINEIYYGERENEKNKKQINEVTINIIKDNKRKIKRILFSFILAITLIIISFLTYYFINNYKSISVYTINGKEDNIDINGIIIISNEEMYIQFEGIDNLNYDDVEKIGLYYEKDDEKKLIVEDTGKLKLYVNKFGRDEDIPHKNFKYIRNKLWIEILYNNGKIHNIKLDLQRTFNNNNIFSKKMDNNTKEKEIIELNDSIPKYIKDNFKFNEDEECYYRSTKKKNFIVNEKYYYNAYLYVVEEAYKDYTERFEYAVILDDFHFDKISGDIKIESFGFDLSNNNCYSKKCDKNKMQYFFDTYIDKIDFKK